MPDPTPPRRVKVWPHTYTITLDSAGGLSAAGRHGQCAVDELTIFLNGNAPATIIADTVMHELCHAMLNILDLGDDLEERICSTLGPALYGLIRDNPALTTYLRGPK